MSISLSSYSYTPWSYNYSPSLFTSLQPQTGTVSAGLSASDTVNLLDATLPTQAPGQASPQSLPSQADVTAGLYQQLLGASFGPPAPPGTQPIPGFPVATNPYDPAYWQDQSTGTLLNTLL